MGLYFGLYWAQLGLTQSQGSIPFQDELGFFLAQCLFGQQGSFNYHMAVVVLIANVHSGMPFHTFKSWTSSNGLSITDASHLRTSS